MKTTRIIARATTLLVATIFFLGISGCDFLFNSTPDIETFTANDVSLAEGEQTQLTATAYDSDGDDVTFNFSATIGTLSATSNTTGIVTYTAPMWQPGQQTTAVVTVTVSDKYTDDIDDTGTSSISIELLGTEKTLVVDVPLTYFTSLGTSSLLVKVNGTTIGTVYPSDIATNPTSFNFSYFGYISSVTFESGSYYNVFDDLTDFANNNDPTVTSMVGIDKIQIFAKYSIWDFTTVLGTGADIEPLN